MDDERRLMVELAGMMAAGEPPGPRPAVKGHPKLHVVVGAAIPALPATLRGRIPPSKYMLHIHAPSPDAAALRSSRPQGERTLFMEISEGPRFIPLFSAFLKVLRPDYVDLTVQDGCGPLVDKAAARIKAALDLDLPNLQVDRMSALTRLRCSLMNLAWMGPGSRLKPKISSPGLPALVCGAGPSLNSQFELIARHAKSFAVVASGHAALRLKEAGIEPDFVVEADPRCRINWRPGSPSFDCPLAALSCVDPEVASRFKSHVWLDGDSPEFSSVEELLKLDLPRLAISRGVIVTAIDFAFSLGCSQVALVGCDLSLSKSGESHPGERRADGDELNIVDVEGYEPGSVLRSTSDFNDIRKALEGYLESAVPAKGSVVNCTPGGARINGAGFIPLEDFARGLPQAVKRFELEDVPAPEGFLEGAASISARLAEYLSVSESLLEAAWRLERELRNSVFNAEKVAKLKKGFDAAASAETKLFSEPFLSKILPLPKNRVDDLFDESPGCDPSPEDALGQLKVFRGKTKALSALCSDFKGDVDFALSRLSSPAASTPERDPSFFKAFREAAVDFIAKSNPELAKALASSSFAPAESAGFSLHLKFEDYPHVAKTLADGSRVQFSGLLSVRDEARRQIAEFSRGVSFDPARHAAVFAAPGNYALIEAFSESFPGASCMIVEPWPELLQEIIARTPFLHRLPEGSPVIAVSDSLKSWRSLHGEALESLRKRGLSPMVHWNPKTSGLPEAKALAGLYGG